MRSHQLGGIARWNVLHQHRHPSLLGVGYEDNTRASFRTCYEEQQERNPLLVRPTYVGKIPKTHSIRRSGVLMQLLLFGQLLLLIATGIVKFQSSSLLFMSNSI